MVVKLGIVVLAGGVWVFQDSLASILFYLDDEEESWYYNQPLRIIRALWGLAIVICGISLLIRGC